MNKRNEWVRKRLVMLKRRPHYIPLLMMIISSLVFNIRLTPFSNTTALINEPWMGFCLFVIVLCSYLSIISFMTAFPQRKKPRIVSIVLVCLMLLISIAGQFIFLYFIRYGTELKPNPIAITPARSYVNVARLVSIIHIVLLIMSLLLIFTLPIYRKLLKKIDTSIQLEETNIDNIDFSEEDILDSKKNH
jgi:cytochrome bd-type quinol oxidase subunit 2